MNERGKYITQGNERIQSKKCSVGKPVIQAVDYDVIRSPDGSDVSVSMVQQLAIASLVVVVRWSEHWKHTD